MQDARNPHEAIRTAVQDALTEMTRTNNTADTVTALMRRLLSPEIGWALAALRADGPARIAPIRQQRDLVPRPRVTRWYECSSCLWTAVAEYCRYCENCGARIEWTAAPVVT